jgi:hypothetical protein
MRNSSSFGVTSWSRFFSAVGDVIFQFAASAKGCSTEPLLVVLAINNRTPSDIKKKACAVSF